MSFLTPPTNRKPLKIVILNILLFLIGIRPLIDLNGAYKGEGMNAGGILGIIFAGLMVVLIVIQLLEGKPIYLFNFFIVLIIITFLCGFVSNGFSVETIVPLSRFVVGFSCINILIFHKDNIRLNFVIKILLFSMIIPIVISWMQYFGLYPYSYYDYIESGMIGRPSGGYGQPNSLTRLLIFGTFIIYILNGYNKLNNFHKNIWVLLFGITIFISGHRTSLIIMVIVLLYFEFVVNRKNLRIKFRTPITVSVFIMMIVLILKLFGQHLVEYKQVYSGIFNLVFDNSGHLSVRGRGEVWGELGENIMKNDIYQWLIGHGYSTVEAHNDMLRILFINGLLGIILYSIFFIYTYFYTLRRVDKFGIKAVRILYVYIFIFGLTLQPTDYPYYMWLFFFTIFTILKLSKANLNKNMGLGVK